MIGTTTENPSFEVRGALLSRCRVFVLKQLAESKIIEILQAALVDEQRGLGDLKLRVEQPTLAVLAQMANGDARTALNVLEYSAKIAKDEVISLEIIKEAFQKSFLLYDKNGEEHYNIISALHKSMRGSDADAALYWLARMLEAGEVQRFDVTFDGPNRPHYPVQYLDKDKVKELADYYRKLHQKISLFIRGHR